MGTVSSLRAADRAHTPTVETAVAALTDQLRNTRQPHGHYTSPRTIHAYTTALHRLLDADSAIGDYDTDSAIAALHDRFRELWSHASAATWNARRAALRSLSALALERHWVTRDLTAGLDREPEPRALDRARPRAELDRLLTNQRHRLRDRALWKLLYATAARADEVLALNVDDLDLKNRQAWVTRKGSHRERIAWDTDTAKVLNRLVGHRTRGPVFLTERRGKGIERGIVPEADLDPDSGHKRLSYDTALHTFREATGGWTLHDLRHSALTHAAERGVDVTALMAKSGHRDIRSLARYARPSIEDAQRQWEQTRH